MNATSAAAHQILIVEDDRALRESVGRVLEGEGYDVQKASNGAEAMNLLAQGERPCVILLDLMMPVMNGWQFLEERRAHNDVAGIPVVVMSANLNLPGFAAPHLPVQATLKKPIHSDHLLEVVDRFCTDH
jgi:CheY-like chemotaxis protein